MSHEMKMELAPEKDIFLGYGLVEEVGDSIMRPHQAEYQEKYKSLSKLGRRKSFQIFS